MAERLGWMKKDNPSLSHTSVKAQSKMTEREKNLVYTFLCPTPGRQRECEKKVAGEKVVGGQHRHTQS